MFNKININILIIQLMTIFVLNPIVLRAESYQFEVNGGYEKLKTVNNSHPWTETQSTDYKSSICCFFNPVSVDGKPWICPAFFQKAGYISAARSKGITELREGDLDNYSYESDAKVFLGDIPLYLRAEYEWYKAEGSLDYPDAYELAYSIKAKSKTYSGELGYYLTDFLATSLSFTRIDLDEWRNEKGSYLMDDKVESNTDKIGFDFKYYISISAELSLILEGSYTRGNTEWYSSIDGFYSYFHCNSYMLAADLYIIPHFSFGISLTVDDDEAALTETTVMVNAAVFPIPNIGFTVGFGMIFPDESNDYYNNEQFLFGVTGRI